MDQLDFLLNDFGWLEGEEFLLKHQYNTEIFSCDLRLVDLTTNQHTTHRSTQSTRRHSSLQHLSCSVCPLSSVSVRVCFSPPQPTVSHRLTACSPVAQEKERFTRLFSSDLSMIELANTQNLEILDSNCSSSLLNSIAPSSSRGRGLCRSNVFILFPIGQL